MEEEDGCNEGEGEDQHNEGVSEQGRRLLGEGNGEIGKHTHTLKPGESSV